MDRSYLCKGGIFNVWVPALTALLLAAAASPVQAQTPSQECADFLRARNWWLDAGSFGDQAWGFVYIFGNPAGGDWYTGTRVAYRGSYGDTPLGIAWYPFEYDGYYGVEIDRGYATELYLLTDFDPQTETLTLYDINDSSYVYWTSTRSPYTPTIIRNLYYR